MAWTVPEQGGPVESAGPPGDTASPVVFGCAPPLQRQPRGASRSGACRGARKSARRPDGAGMGRRTDRWHAAVARPGARKISGCVRPGAGDGITANIQFPFPGTLREAVLAGGTDRGPADPWQVDCLVWAVLEVLRSGAGDERLGSLTRPSPGCDLVRPGPASRRPLRPLRSAPARARARLDSRPRR